MTRLAQRLGAVHRGVGITEQIFGTFVLWRAKRDSHAGRGEDVLVAQRKRAHQLTLDPFRNSSGIAHVLDVFEQNSKFIAAKTRHSIAGAQTSFETASDRDEQLISNHVAKTVVDILETIEIKEQNCEQIILAPFTVPDRYAETIDKERAIREPGQGIMQGIVQQLLFGDFSLGDIAD